MAKAARLSGTDSPGPTPLRARLDALGFVRSGEDRILTGVVGGLADRWGFDSTILRVALGVLTLAGGAGIALYAILVLLSSEPRPRAYERPSRRDGLRPLFAIALIVWGLLVMFREAGLWLGDSLVWPVALAALGATVIRTRSDGDRGFAWGPVGALLTGRGTIVRILLGAGLVIIGAGTFLAAVDVFAAARTFAVPVLVTLAGASLIFGPWLLRVGQQLSDERRERIRSQERSEMAAHLHDSVLQTLALIQRSHDARSMSSLARVQERELRAWLYGRSGFAEDETLAGAMNAAAGRVEQMHKVSVETILVGDAPLDDRVQALVHACAEAMNNAARHSGVTAVSVYVEVEDDAITVYVRDQGRGFDVAAVPDDRRGIAESIRARMARFGGSATISSSVSEGTEVQLRLARKSA